MEQTDPTNTYEAHREIEAEDQYAEAIDNILTGDIHLVPDVFLFVQIYERIAKWKRDMLAEINMHDLKKRCDTILFKELLPIDTTFDEWKIN